MSVTTHTHILWSEYLKSTSELSQQILSSRYINYHNLSLFVMYYILQYPILIIITSYREPLCCRIITELILLPNWTSCPLISGPCSFPHQLPLCSLLLWVQHLPSTWGFRDEYLLMTTLWQLDEHHRWPGDKYICPCKSQSHSENGWHHSFLFLYCLNVPHSTVHGTALICRWYDDGTRQSWASVGNLLKQIREFPMTKGKYAETSSFQKLKVNILKFI